MTIDNFQFSTNGTYVSGKKNITVVEDVAGLNKDVLSHVTIDKKSQWEKLLHPNHLGQHRHYRYKE